MSAPTVTVEPTPRGFRVVITSPNGTRTTVGRWTARYQANAHAAHLRTEYQR